MLNWKIALAGRHHHTKKQRAFANKLGYTRLDHMSGHGEYSISEVAEASGVTRHTLRYYERAGMMLEVSRKSNGHRCYRQDHIRWVLFLKRLRSAGMSIAQVREYARLAQNGNESIGARALLLQKYRDRVRDQLEPLSDHLELIESKLKRYRDSGVACGPEDYPWKNLQGSSHGDTEGTEKIETKRDR